MSWCKPNTSMLQSLPACDVVNHRITPYNSIFRCNIISIEGHCAYTCRWVLTPIETCLGPTVSSPTLFHPVLASALMLLSLSYYDCYNQATIQCWCYAVLCKCFFLQRYGIIVIIDIPHCWQQAPGGVGPVHCSLLLVYGMSGHLMLSHVPNKE